MSGSGLARDEADSGVMFEQLRRIRRSDPKDNGRNMARKKKTAKKKQEESVHAANRSLASVLAPGEREPLTATAWSRSTVGLGVR